jgi:hypothetical protein
LPLSEQDIRDRIALKCPPERDPVLSAAHMDQLVRLARRADTLGNAPDSYSAWQPGVTYGVGDMVVPDPRNGRVYRATVAGAAGTSVPVWPASGTVVDGGVTWTMAGAAPWTPTWAINSAVAEGWRVKAGIAAERYRFSTGSESFERNTVLENCLRMAELYAASGGVRSRHMAAGLETAGAYPSWPPVIGN